MPWFGVQCLNFGIKLGNMHHKMRCSTKMLQKNKKADHVFREAWTL